MTGKSMNQQRELSRIAEHWQNPGVRCVITDRAQTSFFWHCFRQQQSQSSIIEVPTAAAQLAGWYEQLSQSFLGSTKVYWLVFAATGRTNAKVKKQVLTFLQTYQGPHTLWLLLDQDEAKELSNRSVVRYVVPTTVTGTQLGELTKLLGLDRSAQVLSVAGVTKLRTSLTLDAASSVAYHAQYVPVRSPKTAKEYLARLIPHDGSLSHVADLYFKHDWPAFFIAWKKLQPSYADMFWVAFWTEQLWRAYWTCSYLQQGQKARARSMSYRLPPSFLHTTWKRQVTKNLLNAYEQLSFFDTRVKKGSVFTLNELLTHSVGVVSAQ